MATSLSISARRTWLFALFLMAATFIAYYPAWHGDYLWDDDTLVPHSQDLQDSRYYTLQGLEDIWFHPPHQYYPVTDTVCWVEYHLWGLDTTGYHVVNILLHSLNAILLWLVLRQLKVPGAWLAGAIFALHPVNVESAAWIAERKNTLSCFFYLCAILAALKFWLPQETARADSPPAARLKDWKFFWLAYVLFLCALFSKTTTVPLPAVILLLVWWKRGKITRADVYPSLLFFATAVGMGLVTRYFEQQSELGGVQISLMDRFLIAGRDFWFYLGKLFWPHPLILVYPRWQIAPSPPLAWLSLLAFVPVAIILWLARHSWGRPVFIALAYFAGLLFVMLGFFNITYFSYSFVADHFQYLAMMGPLALVCAGVALVFRRLGKARHILAPLLATGLLAALGTLTWQQCRMYANEETLWRTTLARCPDARGAHFNLGLALAEEGRLDEAIGQYQEALKFDQGQAAGHDYNDLGVALFQKGQTDAAIIDYHKALEYYPGNAAAYGNLGRALLSEGRLEDAAAQYQAALKLQPDNEDFQSTLGAMIWMLTKSPQAKGEETLALAKNANQLAGGNSALTLRALAAAYARCGQFPEAIAAGKRALALAANDQSPAFMNTLEQEVALYQSGSPLPLIKQTNTAGGGKR